MQAQHRTWTTRPSPTLDHEPGTDRVQGQHRQRHQHLDGTPLPECRQPRGQATAQATAASHGGKPTSRPPPLVPSSSHLQPPTPGRTRQCSNPSANSNSNSSLTPALNPPTLHLSRMRYRSDEFLTFDPLTAVMMSPRTRRPYSSRLVPWMPAFHAGPFSRAFRTRTPAGRWAGQGGTGRRTAGAG